MRVFLFTHNPLAIRANTQSEAERRFTQLVAEGKAQPVVMRHWQTEDAYLKATGENADKIL